MPVVETALTRLLGAAHPLSPSLVGQPSAASSFARPLDRRRSLSSRPRDINNEYREKITATAAGSPQLKERYGRRCHGGIVIIPADDRLSRDTTDFLPIAGDMQRAGHSCDRRWSGA